MECLTQQLADTLIVTLSGTFVFSDHATFKKTLDQAEDERVRHVHIELARLEFIDSAGLGMLLLMRDVCAKHKKNLVLSMPTGQVKKVFDVSRFEHLFTIKAA